MRCGVAMWAGTQCGGEVSVEFAVMEEIRGFSGMGLI